MRREISLIAALFFFNNINAQKKDSIRYDKDKVIDEVVITGQFGNRSIKQSLYKVEVIGRAQIEKMGANNVADVLNQSLNILIIPERNSGNSKANIMGLGANYTKILIDNIPLVGDEGLGSNIDLTKLNLDNIEKIEIVRGSMGVEYGSNAIAGVINIITKKNHNKDFSVRGFIQEETVGKEYDWIDYGKGKHIQSLSVSKKIGSKIYAQAGINRTDFQGFWGEMQGKNHVLRDKKRGYEWQPKEQLNPSLMLRYSDKDTQLMYKVDYLNEEVNVYNSEIQPERLNNGKWTYISRDKDYHTERWLHHFALNSNVFQQSKLSIDASYQSQERALTNRIFDIPQRTVLQADDKYTYYKANTFFSRGTLHYFLPSNTWGAQLGYEADYTEGFASHTTGRYAGKNLSRGVFSGGVFASAEFNFANNWFIKPGIRYNFSNVFKTVPNFSLVLKNTITPRSEFRAVVGTSNRNPTFEELYTYFVDSNHDIRGNENLIPETSYSGSIFYTISSTPENDIRWTVDFNSMYMLVRNQIIMALINASPLQYQFANINSYESWLNSLSLKLKYKQFSLNAGGSILGRSHGINAQTENIYRYASELNAGLTIDFPKSNTSFSALYRGISKSYEVQEDKSLGVTQYLVVERAPFQLLDASLTQKFWKNKIAFTLGTKNILDVKNVIGTAISGGAHGSVGSNASVFYGRSYFARLNFNF